jgi:ATP phosphoribosyltransferase
MDDSRLKLAVQKSGRLTDPSLELLGRCGLKLSPTAIGIVYW